MRIAGMRSFVCHIGLALTLLFVGITPASAQNATSTALISAQNERKRHVIHDEMDIVSAEALGEFGYYSLPDTGSTASLILVGMHLHLMGAFGGTLGFFMWDAPGALPGKRDHRSGGVAARVQVNLLDFGGVGLVGGLGMFLGSALDGVSPTLDLGIRFPISKYVRCNVGYSYLFFKPTYEAEEDGSAPSLLSGHGFLIQLGIPFFSI